VEGIPTLIEAVTYRLGPHSTADDAGRYQPRDEVERWKDLDPLRRYREFLEARGVLDEDFVLHAEEEARREMARMREGVLASDPRPQSELFEWVFAGKLPQHLSRQRDDMLDQGDGDG
jgi:TPP-dependent pyruvate/acetoin dehydrogenase alpha subunit